MKICMLIWGYWPGLQGGAERQARLIAGELVKHGLECEVVAALTSFGWSRHADDNGIQVHRLGLLVPSLLAIRDLAAKCARFIHGSNVQSDKSRLGVKSCSEFWVTLPWMWLARLNFIIEFIILSKSGRIKCDVIHLHEPSWLGGVAELASRWIGCSVVCQEATSPALPVIGYDTPFRKVWARLRMKPTYIAMAGYTVEQLIERGVSRERIHLLPSGVKVPPSSTCGMGTSNVLYVANYSQGAAWKAFDVLFDAWVLVARRMPQARLYAVGGGDSTEWHRYLVKKNVANTVVFTGTVHDIEKYYSESSIFLLPSRVEGLSNALLEAQMWGLACVVSNIPGNMSVVKHEVNGLVVPVNNAQQLADAILRLLGDEKLRGRFGKAARESAVSKFSIQSVAERLILIYQDILTKRLRCEQEVNNGRLLATEDKKRNIPVDERG